MFTSNATFHHPTFNPATASTAHSTMHSRQPSLEDILDTFATPPGRGFIDDPRQEFSESSPPTSAMKSRQGSLETACMNCGPLYHTASSISVKSNQSSADEQLVQPLVRNNKEADCAEIPKEFPDKWAYMRFYLDASHKVSGDLTLIRDHDHLLESMGFDKICYSDPTTEQFWRMLTLNGFAAELMRDKVDLVGDLRTKA